MTKSSKAELASSHLGRSKRKNVAIDISKAVSYIIHQVSILD